MILFVGQAPGRRAPRNQRAFGGPGAGSRLAALSGLPQQEFLWRFVTVNVFKQWPGRKGKGDRFDMPAARRNAVRLRWMLMKADRIVFVGAATTRAFRGVVHFRHGGIDKPCVWRTGYLSTSFLSAHEFAYLPHPSGVNHWYNSAANRQLAQTFMRDLVEEG